ncbi:MAG: hypothetical protein GXP41_02635 [Chloroflexi bacterium]|nr:hypothetical protein [Chloroflexota bacterium]
MLHRSVQLKYHSMDRPLVWQMLAPLSPRFRTGLTGPVPAREATDRAGAGPVQPSEPHQILQRIRQKLASKPAPASPASGTPQSQTQEVVETPPSGRAEDATKQRISTGASPGRHHQRKRRESLPPPAGRRPLRGAVEEIPAPEATEMVTETGAEQPASEVQAKRAETSRRKPEPVQPKQPPPPDETFIPDDMPTVLAPEAVAEVTGSHRLSGQKASPEPSEVAQEPVQRPAPADDATEMQTTVVLPQTAKREDRPAPPVTQSAEGMKGPASPVPQAAEREERPAPPAAQRVAGREQSNLQKQRGAHHQGRKSWSVERQASSDDMGRPVVHRPRSVAKGGPMPETRDVSPQDKGVPAQGIMLRARERLAPKRMLLTFRHPAAAAESHLQGRSRRSRLIARKVAQSYEMAVSRSRRTAEPQTRSPGGRVARSPEKEPVAADDRRPEGPGSQAVTSARREDHSVGQPESGTGMLVREPAPAVVARRLEAPPPLRHLAGRPGRSGVTARPDLARQKGTSPEAQLDPAAVWSGPAMRPLPFARGVTPEAGVPPAKDAVSVEPAAGFPARGVAPVVQRTVTDEAGAGVAQPVATGGAIPAAGPPEEASAGGSVNLDRLARQVYQILRRRLRVEKERMRGSIPH